MTQEKVTYRVLLRYLLPPKSPWLPGGADSLGGPWLCARTQTLTNFPGEAAGFTPRLVQGCFVGKQPTALGHWQEQGKPCPGSPHPLPAPATPLLVQAALKFADTIITSPVEKELRTRCS